MSTFSIAPTSDTRPAVRAAGVRNPAAPRPSAVRLTQRGRVVVFVAALVLMFGAALFAGSVAVGSSEAGSAPATEIIQVGPGDTLWGIAADLSTDGDVRSTMREIEALNALDSVLLSTGQRLRVPAGE